jgi:2-succinyl-6-hydroxy-2,4-cyclohexadiene-1-carboxylate synthase
MLPATTEGKGHRVVLVHGFGQTRNCWGPFTGALVEGHEVVRLDAPGHGRAGDVRADLAETADLLAQFGRATYVGYSMGGRMALELALRHPDTVERLVLISATAGIEDTAERAQRRTTDALLAERIESEGVDAFVEHWLALSLFAGLPPEGRFEDERGTNTPAGLAGSLRLAGTGSQEPSWDRLGSLPMPVLVVTGEDDPKFTDLGQRMAAEIGPDATLAVIPGAGHSVHLEQPEAFLRASFPTVAEGVRRRGPGRGPGDRRR